MRSYFISIVSVFTVTVCCLRPICGQVQRPNVVILMADQLRYESCGYAGDDKARTPHIDQLAKDGMSFDN